MTGFLKVPVDKALVPLIGAAPFLYVLYIPYVRDVRRDFINLQPKLFCMTVKDLKILLAYAPDDAYVLIPVYGNPNDADYYASADMSTSGMKVFPQETENILDTTHIVTSGFVISPHDNRGPQANIDDAQVPELN